MQNKLISFSSLVLISVLFLLPIQTRAQTSSAGPLITQPVDEANLVVLHGNTHPLALAKYDRGAAPANLPMQRMLLVLQRSPAQESALEQLLEQQQDNSSPNYHQWLTPQQFGAQYGPADQDIQTVTTWLQSHGFQVNRVSSGRVVIEFSGTAGQVAEALHTTIHKYEVNGEEHWANANDPEIPAALVPVVGGVRSLYNFPARPMNHFAGSFRRDKDTGKVIPVESVVKPLFAFGTGCGILGGPCEALGPYDLATIYNVSPLWNATTPIDGTGQTIAIVAETDINPADWTSFWNMFGVANPKGTLNVIHDGPDPGILQDGEESESDIDTQWSSAVAKGATIDFVVSQSTETTFGVDLSAEYIVDNNLAPVMSESYGICELFIGTAGNTYYNTLWQQASAQGITVFISSGDQGSAVCDGGSSAAQFGLAVNGFGSTPYNVSVGGTDFNDLTTTGTYWNATNDANQANAKSYIPEMTWNDSCTNAEIFSYLGDSTAEQTCNDLNAQNDGFLFVTGGSGGASNCISSNGQLPSTCTAGYPKPVWQTGTGVPADSKRDVPDVSLFASNGFNNTFYIVCESDVTGACSLGGGFLGFGGTSVSSPAFAGIAALVNQKTGSRQGNANYVFYKMAAGTGNSCNSNTVSVTGSNNCIFYDIPAGSTIAMPCATGTQNCTTNTTGHQFGVLSGFSTGTGYDLATGLGTVNVTNLVNQWSTYAGQFKATTISPFTLGPPTTIMHGQSVSVAATVKPQTGTGTPTGTITLIANTGSSASAQTAVQQVFTLANGSIAAGAATTMLPGGNNYSVTTHYSGDITFAPSNSAPFTMTVNPEASKTQAEVETYNSSNGQITNSNATTYSYGTPTILRASVTNSSGNPCAPNGIQVYGCPTGAVSLTDTFNGVTSPIDLSPYALNGEGYTEDQAIFLPGGQHSIVAAYSSDNSYNASSSSATPDVITVNKAVTTIALYGGGLYVAGTSVSVSAVVGTQIFVPSVAPLADYPSGAVQFYSGSTPITGLLTTVSGPGPNGYAQLSVTLQLSTLPVGNNTITAQFVGDSNYLPSVLSNAVTVENEIPTYMAVTTSNAIIQHGSSVTFTAIVTRNQTGGPPFTGTVQFTNNGAPFGSAVPLTNGQAQITTSSLPGGNLFIYANYSGDTNYEGSFNSIQETVLLINTTTTLTSSSSTIQQGSSVTFTAQIAPAQSSGPTVTGTVQFFANGVVIGTPNITNNQAQATTNTLSAGSLPIIANYSGDGYYGSSQGVFTETVTAAPTFGISASPTTVPVATPGASGTAKLTFTGMNGYTGTIPLSPSLCAGMPSETTCSFSAASVTLSGSATTATAMVTFQTTAASPALLPPSKRWPGLGWWMPAGMGALVCAFCLGILLAGYCTGHRRWGTALAVLAVVSLMAMVSCGGGGSGYRPPPNPGTPVGLDPNVIVTFSGAGVTPSPTLTLSVNVE